MADPRFVSRRGFLQSAVLIVGSSLLAACQQGPAPSTAPPPAAGATTAPAAGATTAPAAKTSGAASFTIGAVMPLTGRYASLAEQVKNGYELAFEDLNKSSKNQLQLKLLDDE